MGISVKKITDPEFKTYGRIITGYQIDELLQEMEKNTSS